MSLYWFASSTDENSETLESHALALLDRRLYSNSDQNMSLSDLTGRKEKCRNNLRSYDYINKCMKPQ